MVYIDKFLFLFCSILDITIIHRSFSSPSPESIYDIGFNISLLCSTCPQEANITQLDPIMPEQGEVDDGDWE